MVPCAHDMCRRVHTCKQTSGAAHRHASPQSLAFHVCQTIWMKRDMVKAMAEKEAKIAMVDLICATAAAKQQQQQSTAGHSR